MNGSRAVQMCRKREERIAALSASVARLALQLAQTEATRDRYQKNGKRLLAQMRELDSIIAPMRERMGEMGELESIIAFPGVMRALEKALHPDTGAGGDTATRTAMFQTLMTIRNRMAGG
jgi:hypothetical protein